jgi:hypothetical protein
MTSHELIKHLIARRSVEPSGFWMGNPHLDIWPILHRYFGTETEQQWRVKLGDDVRWMSPQFYSDVYRDPESRTLEEIERSWR